VTVGTRADFYVGRGENAEWLGSIAWDGYPDGITPKGRGWPEGGALFDATDEATFRERDAEFFAGRGDVTLRALGWPWPWDNSSTPEYAYAFDGHVWASCFGGKWYKADDPALNEDESSAKEAVFPDMKARQNVTFGPRSGVMIFGA
jgi:hypothetical protein